MLRHGAAQPGGQHDLDQASASTPSNSGPATCRLSVCSPDLMRGGRLQVEAAFLHLQAAPASTDGSVMPLPLRNTDHPR